MCFHKPSFLACIRFYAYHNLYGFSSLTNVKLMKVCEKFCINSNVQSFLMIVQNTKVSPYHIIYNISYISQGKTGGKMRLSQPYYLFFQDMYA